MKKVITILLSAITVLSMSVTAFATEVSKDNENKENEVRVMLISSNSEENKTYDVISAINKFSNNVVINGKTISIENLEILIENGQVMVPLRATAEKLGFKVTWDENNKVVSLDNDEIKTDMTIGIDSYYYASSHAIGCTAPFSYGAAPMIVDNVIYIPIRVYNLLCNNTEAVGSFWSMKKDGQYIYVDKGSLATGWKNIDYKWYFMNEQGIMQKGWIKSNGVWYYLYDNGQMANNTITPDGYKVDGSGAWIK